MVIIRKEQMEVLSKNMVNQFVDNTLIHLRTIFPDQTQDMTDQQLRDMIQAGINEAESYEITDEVDVERFLECIVRYGRDYDTDPKTSWAGEILRDESLTGMEKMNQINDYELFVLTVGQL